MPKYIFRLMRTEQHFDGNIIGYITDDTSYYGSDEISYPHFPFTFYDLFSFIRRNIHNGFIKLCAKVILKILTFYFDTLEHDTLTPSGDIFLANWRNIFL